MSRDPFTLFAAYHLGVTADGEYHFGNLHEAARRLGLAPAELLRELAEARLDADTLLRSGYDLAAAQVEVMVAATADERLATARRHFEALRATPPHPREWERELAEDAEENERVFGKRTPRGPTGGS